MKRITKISRSIIVIFHVVADVLAIFALYMIVLMMLNKKEKENKAIFCLLFCPVFHPALFVEYLWSI